MRIYPAKPDKVYFYATCLVDMFDPEAGLDAMTLLEQQGIDVIFVEKQTCCGQPAYSSGYDEEAKQVALSQIELFPQSYPVIVLSGSCGGMMHHHYRRLFKGDSHEAQVSQFCDRVFELTEFLVNVCRVKLNDQGQPTSVVMHTSCAARREMNVHVTATELLSQLNNVELRIQDYESECCGFGGTFSVRHPNISQAMVEDKTRHIEATAAETLVSADWGCLLNINGAFEYQGKAIKGRHLASFLLERIGGKA
ncbi:(Fe-S)-binding protein [Vibrio vulnificus]|uniref:(Fe-S)-binding protein n=1 Tax=Vibrio vulnificus TaxID=672 RepID=UPI00165D94E2|nr:(Fe-S)-binding protein [Vibrio vulnificus]EGR9006094.1 (Fe-S)-binding protein [Vibrio vulnificus]MBN8144369.1 (Fe-S)-binding protein [Vibrio vulnificus]HAS6159525.1 (Fe-S)-binding protein [Vibrio vulnificus]HAS8255484.1 (Fe-S)-binding protein [Vibrio vulnificus]HBC3533351.1 (Fe-S)-binding protein [Vibrio vulnificus]